MTMAPMPTDLGDKPKERSTPLGLAQQAWSSPKRKSLVRPMPSARLPSDAALPMPLTLTFHGVRGSIASPGIYTVRYGGNTACAEVLLEDGTRLVLDAGTGLRSLGDKLLATNAVSHPVHLLLTHTHWDHVQGLPFFAPIFSPKAHLLLYPLPKIQERFRTELTVFDELHFPVQAKHLPSKIERIADTSSSWTIGSAKVSRIQLNHPGGAQGFRIDDRQGRSIAYLTDNELSPPGARVTTLDRLATFAHGVDILVHDAQYLPTDMPMKHGWGHSLVDEVLLLAKLSEARQVVLFHHDPSRRDDELDQITLAASAWLEGQHASSVVIAAYEGLSLEAGLPRSTRP